MMRLAYTTANTTAAVLRTCGRMPIAMLRLFTNDAGAFVEALGATQAELSRLSRISSM